MMESKNVISPLREAAAYEAIWCSERFKPSFKKIAKEFSKSDESLPSAFVGSDEIAIFQDLLRQNLSGVHDYRPQIIVNHTFDYPQRLREAKEPVEILYYAGNIGYLTTKGLAIVGTRHPSPAGVKRTQQLVRELVKDNFTIYSGLAEGIDTAAHQAALQYNGRTVAVIGTPIGETYPAKNKVLQIRIAQEHLLISQVPIIKYKRQGFPLNKLFFPERNKTMSALAEGTIIVEAGERSGSLIQAKAAIEQGRKLFILQSCFEDPSLTWPSKFEKLGAIRVRTYSDIKREF